MLLTPESNVSPPAIELLAGPSDLSELAGETVQLECAVSMPSSRDLHIIWTRQGSFLHQLYLVFFPRAGKLKAGLII